jgi:hypothetical protein
MIGLDWIIPVLLHDMAHRRQQLIEYPRGHCCFDEEDASVTVDCAWSDREREFGKGSCEPVSSINVGG